MTRGISARSFSWARGAKGATSEICGSNGGRRPPHRPPLQLGARDAARAGGASAPGAKDARGGTVRGCPSAGVPRDRCGPQRVSPLAVVAGVEILFEKKPAEASFPKELFPGLKILFGKEAK